MPWGAFGDLLDTPGEALGMPWQSSLTIEKMIEALLIEAMLGSVMRKNEKRHTFYLLAGES